MPQEDTLNDAGSIELEVIDGVETLHITGKDFIKVSCDPNLPTTIVPFDMDGKQGLLINGTYDNGTLLIQGRSAVVLTAPAIYLDALVYLSKRLQTETHDLLGTINKLYKRLKR